MSEKRNVNKNLLRALLIAPLAVIPALFFYAIYAAFVEMRFPAWQGPRILVVWEVFADMAVPMLMQAYFGSVLFGIPVFLALRSLKIVNLATLVIAGLLGSYILEWLYHINPWIGGEPSLSGWLTRSYFFIPVIIVFWLVYGRGKNLN